MIGAAHAASDAAGHAAAFYETPEFWVALAFVIMIGGAFKPVMRIITTALDNRASQIRNQIDEAQRLRDEAQELLASYERKQRDAAREAEQIVERARRETERSRENAAQELERSLQRREQSAMDRIAQAETQAIEEIRATAVDVAMEATRRILASDLPKKKAGAMIDEAIKDLPDKLH